MNKRVIIQNVSDALKPQVYQVNTNEHLILILLATRTADYSTQVILTGENAQADIFGIVLGNESNEIQINTLQDHHAPNTISNLLIKSALSDSSQFKYEGFIKVEKGAQQTNAYQRNENLMLSGEAKSESKPALEILANDVRCTHSATMGKVDKEQLFYLQSRGLPLKKATALIVEGFFQSILDKIDDEKSKKEIMREITKLTTN